MHSYYMDETYRPFSDRIFFIPVMQGIEISFSSI